VGEVFRDAVRRQAAAIVVAHNHPSGDTTPSAEDLRITAELAQAGRLLDIELLDHLVIGHGTWTSLRALGGRGRGGLAAGGGAEHAKLQSHAAQAGLRRAGRPNRLASASKARQRSVRDGFWHERARCRCLTAA
jgi:hypothetical protein